MDDRIFKRGLLTALIPLIWAADLQAEGFLCAGLAGHADSGSPRFAAKIAQSPRVGNGKAIVLFAHFRGELPAGTPAPSWARDLFNPDLPGSFTHFYDAMSGGRLRMGGEVAPRSYEALRGASAYVVDDPTEPGLYSQFALEILSRADGDIDFSRFDDDGPDQVPNSGDDDGFVDALFIVVPSLPRNFLKGGATGIANLNLGDLRVSGAFPVKGVNFVTDDLGANGKPVRIKSSLGTIQRGRTFAEAAGTLCHEYGHILGLPDLFNVKFAAAGGRPQEDSAGIGAWGLMGWGATGWHGDDGPNPFCAWSLEQLGWIDRDSGTLVELAGDGDLRVDPLHAAGAAVRIPLHVESSASGSYATAEYLLLEHRSRGASFYDRHIPGEGLLLWHVRPQGLYEVGARDRLLDLVCADGLFADAGYPRGRVADAARGSDNLDFWAHDTAYRALHNGNLGDATDPFDGVSRTRFSRQSNPSNRLRGVAPEASTGVALTIQRREGALWLGVERPRWAGVIGEEVVWSRQARVVGDLRVGPRGTLSILPGTQVRFAATDLLRAGADPDRVELVIEGNFAIVDRGADDPVVFAGATPGAEWYGIEIGARQGAARYIQVPTGSYEISGALRGIEIQGAPPAARGQIVERRGLGAARDSLGGADFFVAPGGEFQLVVEMENWSLGFLEGVQFLLGWRTPWVRPVAGAAPQVHVPSFDLYPGERRVLRFPKLALSEDAADAREIEFYLSRRAQRPADYFALDTLYFKVAAPATARLRPNYPNPFNGQTAIPYQVLQATTVELAIYNAAGQPVRRLVRGVRPPGHYRVFWDGADDRGRALGNGVYFYRFTAGEHRQARRLLLLK